MKIGFIGSGNMGGALINGLLKAKNNTVYVYDAQPEKAESFAGKGAYVCASVSEIAELSEFLVLTVKPNIYPMLLKQLAAIPYNKVLISVAPGITVQYIQNLVPNAKIVRTMPNTPALVGEGITLIADTEDKNLLRNVQEMLNCVGKTVILPENMLEPGTALSGSSPAIVYKLIETMADSALSYGIPKQTAIEIAAQTVLGSAKMVLETKLHPSVLIDNVCSPGGTTIAAMNELAKQGFDSAILSSMERCVEKTRSMKK